MGCGLNIFGRWLAWIGSSTKYVTLTPETAAFNPFIPNSTSVFFFLKPSFRAHTLAMWQVRKQSQNAGIL